MNRLIIFYNENIQFFVISVIEEPSIVIPVYGKHNTEWRVMYTIPCKHKTSMNLLRYLKAEDKDIFPANGMTHVEVYEIILLKLTRLEGKQCT